MRPRCARILQIIAAILIITLIFCGCSTEGASASTPSKAAASAAEVNAQKVTATAVTSKPRSYDTISVALYPYIPNLEFCEQLLASYWEEIAPEVSLEFVYWDAYSGQDLTGIDILMYDAMFTTNLVENGYIQPIAFSDVEYPNDKRILPFAMEGAVHNGELYGIPVFACSYFLIHEADDAQMAEVDNFPELYTLISQRKLEDESTGLTTDFEYNLPCFYLDALMDFSGEYTLYDEVPDTTAPDEAVAEMFAQTRSILAQEAYIAEELVVYNANAAAFSLGFGCAHYGYSENMCDMYDILNDITIRSISFSEKENIPLFFADIASIATHVTDPQKIADCKKIINILGSKDFQVTLCQGRGTPQYILPARQSAYATLAKEYPMYKNLHKLVVNDTNQVFRVGYDINAYLEKAGNDLIF